VVVAQFCEEYCSVSCFWFCGDVSFSHALWHVSDVGDIDVRIVQEVVMNFQRIFLLRLFAFSALTLLVGQQEGHPVCNKLIGGVLVWLSVE